jgi:hypothetical protein
MTAQIVEGLREICLELETDARRLRQRNATVDRRRAVCQSPERPKTKRIEFGSAEPQRRHDVQVAEVAAMRPEGGTRPAPARREEQLLAVAHA